MNSLLVLLTIFFLAFQVSAEYKECGSNAGVSSNQTIQCPSGACCSSFGFVSDCFTRMPTTFSVVRLAPFAVPDVKAARVPETLWDSTFHRQPTARAPITRLAHSVVPTNVALRVDSVVQSHNFVAMDVFMETAPLVSLILCNSMETRMGMVQMVLSMQPA